jgi:hypothetical protein
MIAPHQTGESFLVLFFKKEQALLFEKRSKNFLSVSLLQAVLRIR